VKKVFKQIISKFSILCQTQIQTRVAETIAAPHGPIHVAEPIAAATTKALAVRAEMFVAVAIQAIAADLLTP